MTAEEIDKYINQIAFSGASDFLSKYKEEDDKGSQIIGHFGLGFYSAFMVADSVEIDSLSYQDGAKAAKWTCDGSMEFDLTDGDRTERGTTITLNIAEDSKDFLKKAQSVKFFISIVHSYLLKYMLKFLRTNTRTTATAVTIMIMNTRTIHRQSQSLSTTQHRFG